MSGEETAVNERLDRERQEPGGSRVRETASPNDDVFLVAPPSPTTSLTPPQQGATNPPPPAQLPNLAKEYLDRRKDPVEAKDDDFRPTKKRKVLETGEEDQELQTCSICFEPWSNSGSHRIASLRCGHLFGLGCIEKWLRNAGGGKCPQCNCRAKRKDIRVIYARAVSVLDTAEKDRALRALEEEKQLRIKAKRDEAQALLAQNLARSECDRLREEIESLREKLTTYESSGPGGAASSHATAASQGVGLWGGASGEKREGEGEEEGEEVVVAVERRKYDILKQIQVSRNSGARVVAYNAEDGMLVVSKSSGELNAGSGVVKLSVVDLRHTEYVSIHSGQGTIRDMSFRPRESLVLLTAATDKTAKLTSLHSNTTIQNFSLPSPVWACSWNQDDPNYFYCGLQSGGVVLYDVRAPSKQAGSLTQSEGGKCPVTSLADVPREVSSSLNCGGLLMGSLGGCTFWERSNSSMTEFKPHPLQQLPEGPCPSVSFEPRTRHFFSSFRPTRRSPRGQHILFQLHNVPTHKPLSCQPIQHFVGGSTHRLLSRSALFLHPDDSEGRLLAAYGDEGMKTVHIQDVSSTLQLQVLPMVTEPALDVTPFHSHLAVLTPSKLHIYTWK